MGWIRDAINARRPRNAVGGPTFGAPAEAAAVAAAEAGLGLPFPAVLGELYREFDGLWFGESSGRPFPEDGIVYFVLPLRYLVPARDILVELYGRAARDRMVARHGPQEADGYDDDFEEHLSRCVPFDLKEAGAWFRFLTDRDAWGIEPGRVGIWDHDGGVADCNGLFLEYIAEQCRSISHG